jgi:hypothetical protein
VYPHCRDCFSNAARSSSETRGQEAAIAAAVSDDLRRVGVPASAIRFDNAHKRMPVPTQTGNLIVDLPGTLPGPRLAFARAVLIEKERLQRRARPARTRSHVRRMLLWFNDAVLGVTVRYGLQPLLAVAWMALLWVAGVALFAVVENQEAFKPNVPVVLRSPEWTLCALEAPAQILMPSIGRTMTGLAAPGQSQLACFRDQPEAASFPPFNPWMYSLEVMLPGIELGQKAYWTPDPNKRWGEPARIFLYVQITIGLALGLLAVAGLSGLVRSESPR